MLKTLKVLYRFIFKRKLLYVVFIAMVIATGILFSLNPYFFKLFVDAIPGSDPITLMRILYGLVAVRVAAHTFEIINFYLGDIIGFESGKDARVTVFKQVQDLDFAFHQTKSTGSLISAFKRGDGAFFNIFHAIHHRIMDVVISFFVMFYFLVKLDLRISLIVLVSFVVTLIASKYLIAFNVKKRNLFNDEEDAISGIIVDNMINYETVKLFSKENWELTKLKKRFIPWMSKLWGYANTFRLIDVILGIIVNITLFVLLAISINLSKSSVITLGEFVLVVSFVNLYFPKLWELVFSFRDIAKNFSDIEKYFNLLDYEISVKDPVKPMSIRTVKGEIEYKGVHFSYKGRVKNAINGISFKVRQGQSIALVGRSGGGKTTLVKLLMRFYDLNRGQITIDGVNITSFTKSGLRSHIGVVPQEPILFNNTISYNIGYGRPNASLKEVKAASRLANIDEFISSLPKGYSTMVGERGVKLSGGQKQRLAIARVILADPPIIVFDEATSHLDSESENKIQEAFWKASSGKTTIVIAHRLSTVMKADKIVVIDKGKIVEEGTHGELLSKKLGLYKHLWDLQS